MHAGEGSSVSFTPSMYDVPVCMHRGSHISRGSSRVCHQEGALLSKVSAMFDGGHTRPTGVRSL